MRRLTLRTFFRGSILPLLLATLAGCSSAQEADDETSDDALSGGLKAYWADAKKLDLGDLTRVAAGFASDELNRKLAKTSGVAVSIDAPKVYGAHEEPNRLLPQSARIQGLDAIVDALEQQFGTSELGAEANRARLAAIQEGPARYYVEAGFKLTAGLDHAWSFAAPGIDGSASIGFAAGTELESRVIVASDDAGLDAVVQAPLDAAQSLRGFVLPRSIQDIRGMKTGELLALRGKGRVAGNFGLSVPVVTAPGTLAYAVVASAGVSTVVDGELDVQLVRLPGDEVVVDVGVTKGRAVSVRAAISDAFGVKGICDDGERCLRDVKIGGRTVDLAHVVEKAVERQLNQRFSSAIGGGVATTQHRVALSRVRIHLDRGRPDEVARALEHALKFDLRLAQALANRDLGEPNAPVTVDFDAVRATTTTAWDFGFELLGMDIYRRSVVERQGTLVLQTPDEVKALSYDRLQKHAKFLQTEHGYTRVGLGMRTLDARAPTTWKSEANLFVRSTFGDQHVDDDRVLDALDAVVLATGGAQALAAMDPGGAALEQAVHAQCPLPAAQPDGQATQYDETCNLRLLGQSDFLGYRTQGMNALRSALSGPFADLAFEAGSQRLDLDAVMIHSQDALNGIGASLALDYRLDDAALEQVTRRTPEQFRAAVRETLAAALVDRMALGAPATRAAARSSADARYGAAMDKMAQAFGARAEDYRKLLDMERTFLPRVLEGRRYVASPIGVRFEVDQAGAPLVETSMLTSTSHERARVAAKLFDEVLKEAPTVEGVRAEQASALPLLSLAPPAHASVAFSFDVDPQENKTVPRERFAAAGVKSTGASARGDQLSLVSLGKFDLDAVLGAD